MEGTVFKNLIKLILFITYSIHASSGDYGIRVGKCDADRLDHQHEIIKDNSIKYIKKGGLKEGSIVWDIACGNGNMTAFFASVVGEKGHVYALDASEKQIELAKKKIEKLGLKNVTFVVSNIDNIRDSLGKADIVYARFFLMHLSDPNRAIQQMTKLLKKGGVLILEEPIKNAIYSMVCKPGRSSKYLNDILATFDKYFNRKKLHIEIGKELYDICKNLALFSNIRLYKSVSRVDTDRLASITIPLINNFEDRFIEEGIVAKSEWETIKNGFIKNFDVFEYTEYSFAHLLLTK